MRKKKEHKHVTKKVKGSFFYNSPGWKLPKCPLIDEWIIKCDIYISMSLSIYVDIYNGILFNNKNTRNLAICNNILNYFMHEPLC